MSFVVIPNTFTSGTLAASAKVNQNFAALAGGITDGTKEIGCLSLYAASHVSAANMTVVSSVTAANLYAANATVTSALTAASIYANNMYPANVTVTSALTAASIYANNMYPANVTVTSALTAADLIAPIAHINSITFTSQTGFGKLVATGLVCEATATDAYFRTLGAGITHMTSSSMVSISTPVVQLDSTSGLYNITHIPAYATVGSATAELGTGYVWRSGNTLMIS
jgi:hypothetical protein